MKDVELFLVSAAESGVEHQHKSLQCGECESDDMEGLSGTCL